jgi:osmoprotectant transport system permease protein
MFSDEWREKLAQQFDALPERLGGHIGLTLAALAVGIAISIPLGIFVAKRPKFESLVLGAASIIQTIPSLALLALMVFAFGQIGWVPAWLALILYSVLPMLRSTVTGIQGVDPAYIEAAQGIGMNDRQMLWRVQLPLALPSIVAGLRTASVWVVGAATLAQPVGATSLGNYIFVGLQTFNIVAMVFGCVLSAALAMTFDGLLRGLEIAATSRRIGLAVAIGCAVAMISASPLILNLTKSANRDQLTIGSNDNAAKKIKKPFVVGCKAFTEQYILSHAIRKQLDKVGVPYKTRDGMGSAMVFNALVSGEIDCFVDYTGTIWTNYMKRDDPSTPAEMLIDVATYLKKDHDVICLGSLGFSNDYVFAMSRERADQMEIETLYDLAKHSLELTAATDIEFFDRPEWRAVRDSYGLDFKKKITMDATLMYGAIANAEADVIIAFGTDARIDGYDLKLIEDPMYSIPPYDAVLLVSRRMAANRNAMKALRPLINKVTTAQMRKVNGMVDVDRQSPKQAAAALFSL